VDAAAVRRLAARRARESGPVRSAPPDELAPSEQDSLSEAAPLSEQDSFSEQAPPATLTSSSGQAAAEQTSQPEQAAAGAGTQAPEETAWREPAGAGEEGARRPEAALDAEASPHGEAAPHGEVAGLEAGQDAAGPDADGHRDSPGPAWPALRLITLVALAVTTLVLGGLAAWFGTEASSLHNQPSARNLALADPAETSQVTSQVTSAIDALFSYNYASPGTTTKAASRLLTGAAVRQYAALFAEVKKKAPQDKLIVTTTVSNIGVELLTPGTARVLVFATESDGSAGATTPSTAGAMLAVNAVLDGGTWRIAGIDTFSG
jgi:Mce-associated membrane protein